MTGLRNTFADLFERAYKNFENDTHFQIEDSSYQLFLDDERHPADGTGIWVVCRTAEDAIIKITELYWAGKTLEYVSFDHDLGSDMTGLDVAHYMVDFDISHGGLLNEDFRFFVHSQNPVGGQNLRGYLDSYLTIKRNIRVIPMEEVIQKMQEQGYLDVTVLPTGKVAGLMPFMFTVGLCVGLDDSGYERRFCYDSYPEAKEALENWDGKDLPPGKVLAFK